MHLMLVRLFTRSYHDCCSNVWYCEINTSESLCSMLFVFFSTVLQTRNVEYDEVVLSPTAASIPTEHNKAYVTTTPIPTDQNVAYGVHSTST